MDEINKYIITGKGKTIYVSNANGVLLKVDYILEANTNVNKLQEMLNISGNTADRYRIHFSTDKSNVIMIGRDQMKRV